MKRQPKYIKPRQRRNISRPVLVLSCIAVTLVLVLSVMLLLIPKKDAALQTTQPTETTPPTSETTEATTEPTTEPPTEPEETGPQMIPKLAELYAQNPDIAGWVTIPDTVLDYPVMFTPEDPEKYLYADFEGKFHVGGLPFVDGSCSMDPESGNLIIYGHNMNNGTMFRTLMSYEKKTFWQEHPTITFSTLYEERTYEIIAAFYDRVYYTYEDVFKFYKFIDPVDEADFDNAMKNYKHKALYDTGVTAQYGDKLLTLVTCAYHTDFGRFVVVARQASPDTAE